MNSVRCSSATFVDITNILTYIICQIFMYFILVNQLNPTACKSDNMSAGSVCREADLKIPPRPKIPPAELQLSYSFTNVFNQHLHRAANCIHVINTMRDLLFPCHTGSGSAPAVSTSPARHCVRACVRVCARVLHRPRTEELPL